MFVIVSFEVQNTDEWVVVLVVIVIVVVVVVVTATTIIIGLLILAVKPFFTSRKRQLVAKHCRLKNLKFPSRHRLPIPPSPFILIRSHTLMLYFFNDSLNTLLSTLTFPPGRSLPSPPLWLNLFNPSRLNACYIPRLSHFPQCYSLNNTLLGI
jgi:hypothetical protein